MAPHFQPVPREGEVPAEMLHRVSSSLAEDPVSHWCGGTHHGGRIGNACMDTERACRTSAGVWFQGAFNGAEIKSRQNRTGTKQTLAEGSGTAGGAAARN